MPVKNLGENTQVAPELRISCPARLGEIGLTCAVSINRRLRTLSNLDHRSGDIPKVSREKINFFSRLRGGKPGGASSVGGVDDAGHHSSRKRRHNDFAKSLETREESVAVLDRRILEFPLSGYASGIRIAANA